ncbi:MAG: DUF1232 domain-containing protein [Spirochaetaceae bacterium]|nr:DUF1232 domain-containing protein [Spirochaetaceae bacterium]
MSKFKAWVKAKTKVLKQQITILYYIIRHPKIPFYARIPAILALIYFASPIDLIPDFIPIIGFLDDLAVLAFFIFLTYKLTPKAIIDECKEQALNGRGDIPSKWYYAVPIIIIWLALIFLVIWRLFF